MIGLAALALAYAAPDLVGEASREVARRECRSKDSGEIIVCGRRGPNERFRLPGRDAPFTPEGDLPSAMRERMSWIDEGDSGIQSCGPVGPGGWTGCLVKQWNRQTQQNQWGSNRPKKKY
ncbi:hypothetical protein [Sphingomonas jaspsi]|uniref:hypothetical protein n=1 Tax=Sphingomonas jaspsi TaxID=392409 RepID=UPI0004AE0416|nr:hypothetical protein [Sphingomonas jaspsi]